VTADEKDFLMATALIGARLQRMPALVASTLSTELRLKGLIRINQFRANHQLPKL
jgi:hypothetical protein